MTYVPNNLPTFQVYGELGYVPTIAFLEARNDDIFLYLHQEFTWKETDQAIILVLVSNNLIKNKLRNKNNHLLWLNNLEKRLKKIWQIIIRWDDGWNCACTTQPLVTCLLDGLCAMYRCRSRTAENVCRQSIGGRPQAEIIHGGRRGGCFRWQMRSCVMP